MWIVGVALLLWFVAAGTVYLVFRNRPTYVMGLAVSMAVVVFVGTWLVLWGMLAGSPDAPWLAASTSIPFAVLTLMVTTVQAEGCQSIERARCHGSQGVPHGEVRIAEVPTTDGQRFAPSSGPWRAVVPKGAVERAHRQREVPLLALLAFTLVSVVLAACLVARPSLHTTLGPALAAANLATVGVIALQRRLRFAGLVYNASGMAVVQVVDPYCPELVTFDPAVFAGVGYAVGANRWKVLDAPGRRYKLLVAYSDSRMPGRAERSEAGAPSLGFDVSDRDLTMARWLGAIPKAAEVEGDPAVVNGGQARKGV